MLRKIVNENNATEEQILEIARASIWSFNEENFNKNFKSMDSSFVRLLIASGPKLHITRAEIEEHRAYCEKNYHVYLPDGTKKTDWQTDVMVSWPEFRSLATKDNTIPDLDSLALRFIHCYDAAQNIWFLTLQRMRIKFPNPPGGKPAPGTLCELEAIDTVNDLTSLIQQKNGRGIVKPAKGGTNGAPHFYDQNYFSKVKDAGMIGLDNNRHARSITFSWREIEKLFSENCKNRPEEEFDIVFFSLSYDMGAVPDPAVCNVQWPHSIAMYMRWKGDDCLDNEDVVLVGSSGKASDLGGICPPRCGVIEWYITP